MRMLFRREDRMYRKFRRLLRRRNSLADDVELYEAVYKNRFGVLVNRISRLKRDCQKIGKMILCCRNLIDYDEEIDIRAVEELVERELIIDNGEVHTGYAPDGKIRLVECNDEGIRILKEEIQGIKASEPFTYRRWIFNSRRVIKEYDRLFNEYEDYADDYCKLSSELGDILRGGEPLNWEVV